MRAVVARRANLLRASRSRAAGRSRARILVKPWPETADDTAGMPILDLRKFVKKGAVMVRQYLRRVSVVERHIQGQGLEIGALQDPQVVPRGARVRYVDLVPTEKALELHPNKHSRDLVQVDIVDDGQTLSTVADASEDFVISNHFLEHCQDPLRALENMLRVVKPSGVVYLSVPDQRSTFDKGRPTTTAEHVLRDYREGPEVSLRAHAEEAVQHFKGLSDPAEIAVAADRVIDQQKQIHFHCWDDEALLDMLLAARRELGMPFDIEEFSHNEAEFVVVLKKRA